MYWTLNGHTPVPATAEEWSRWFSTKSQKRTVQHTEIESATVSTVFLGLDHSFAGLPMIFETMIFGIDEEYCERYPTWEDAEQGHAEAIAWLLSKGWPKKETT